MSEKSILCFGDSLTWGWVPKDPPVPSERYPRQVRWTGVLADQLGAGYTLVEEGLSSRTTTADDPIDPRLNGAKYLPSALASHLPLDLVIVMLGTNDTKAYFGRSAFDIAMGMSLLLKQIASAAGGVDTTYPAPVPLVVSPPPLGEQPNPWFRELFTGGQAKTRELPRLYKDVADFAGAGFFDAGSVISADGVDGIHLTEQNNRDLGQALANPVRRRLAD
ncbi:SGNH/GDSL hydrolase family protein [Planosporangium flavigriseum]|uniref:Hydrolase n=1 Tax=Planosporangium flavigriseum TaxID=373681 RepID=A0A8J3PKA9_9ACTN|nr:SGNH/GDSL hydrolase family protein [Planosporangium flavigriseum]NJC65088.1 SGNH/GDSL hydrolase family protein [Planosporangium flavigriseum]GIG71703.1 hydrolase [Planosporangium flavigriseum]